jgi:hypothetical protein
MFYSRGSWKKFSLGEKKFFKDPNYRGIAIFGLKTFFPECLAKKWKIIV